jgi:cytoskeletal protein RodZ
MRRGEIFYLQREEAAVASVGETIRSERLRQGLRVVEIAKATKIRPDLLEAIEAGHFDELPAGAYRRSFLRQYAHALGLDEEAAVASFHEEYQDPPVELPAPVPDPPSQSLRRIAVLAALAISIVIYRYAVSGAIAAGGVVAGVVLPPAPALRAPARAPAPPVMQQAVQPENTPVSSVRVEFSATEPVWVSVKCDGADTFTGTLAGAQAKTFAASSEVTVLVGNAGGLTIHLNGKPVGPLGARGEIQMVEFTPNGVRRMPRRPAPAPAATVNTPRA